MAENFHGRFSWGWPITQLTGPKKAPQKWVFCWAHLTGPFLFGAQEFPLQVSVGASGKGREGISRRAPDFRYAFFGRPGNGAPRLFQGNLGEGEMFRIWAVIYCSM